MVPSDDEGTITTDKSLEQCKLSPRELAVRLTDQKGYFVSEPAFTGLIKTNELITSPAYVAIKAANAFHTKTVPPDRNWQTNFTCYKIIGGDGCRCPRCSTITLDAS